MKKKKKADKSIRFLVISLAGVCILIIGLFTLLSAYMNKRSTKTIEEVGRMYMNSMNEQIVLHYETVISLRLSQINAIADTIVPGKMTGKCFWTIWNTVLRPEDLHIWRFIPGTVNLK